MLESRGLPPRARGRPAQVLRDEADEGTTPACAGTTSPAAAGSVRAGDYPRVRGDDDALQGLGHEGAGLPPRARGRPRRDLLADQSPRTTPACAGTTAPSRPSMSGTSDYPRVRGDDIHTERIPSPPRGLPPRARGRLCVAPRPLLGPGTTPACAGTTRAGGGRRVRSADYPRVRGDDVATVRARASRLGLPPRARGRLGGLLDGGDACRTTPACAGTTCPRSTRRSWPGDYPRVRGDDSLVGAYEYRHDGLPPRARGRREVVPEGAVLVGTTPAFAGTTGR